MLCMYLLKVGLDHREIGKLSMVIELKRMLQCDRSIGFSIKIEYRRVFSCKFLIIFPHDEHCNNQYILL